MPVFGDRSLRNIDECHEDLQVLFGEVVKIFDCSVIEGHRPEAEQDAAFAAGKSKLQWPQSKHNEQPAMAADVVPWPVDWNDIRRFYLFGGYVLGVAEQLRREGQIGHRIRWGGDWDGDFTWKDQSFHDLPHFELAEVDTGIA